MKDITKQSWNKLWYLNIIFGIWVVLGLVIIAMHAFTDTPLLVNAHYLIGIPGYALAGEMLSIVGFKGWKHVKGVVNEKLTNKD